ncbi:hypothetical protein [Acinetobacter brisouii]
MNRKVNESVLVFTHETIDQINQNGYSGKWVAKAERLAEVEYVICISNSKKESEFEHGRAFLIGKVSGVDVSKTDNSEEKTRKLIKISEFSRLPNTESLNNVWEKLTNSQRQPIKYFHTDELLSELLMIDLDKLKWEKTQNIFLQNEENKTINQIIDEARQRISAAAGVLPEMIDINIRY